MIDREREKERDRERDSERGEQDRQTDRQRKRREEESFQGKKQIVKTDNEWQKNAEVVKKIKHLRGTQCHQRVKWAVATLKWALASWKDEKEKS